MNTQIRLVTLFAVLSFMVGHSSTQAQQRRTATREKILVVRRPTPGGIYSNQEAPLSAHRRTSRKLENTLLGIVIGAGIAAATHGNVGAGALIGGGAGLLLSSGGNHPGEREYYRTYYSPTEYQNGYHDYDSPVCRPNTTAKMNIWQPTNNPRIEFCRSVNIYRTRVQGGAIYLYYNPEKGAFAPCENQRKAVELLRAQVEDVTIDSWGNPIYPDFSLAPCDIFEARILQPVQPQARRVIYHEQTPRNATVQVKIVPLQWYNTETAYAVGKRFVQGCIQIPGLYRSIPESGQVFYRFLNPQTKGYDKIYPQKFVEQQLLKGNYQAVQEMIKTL